MSFRFPDCRAVLAVVSGIWILPPRSSAATVPTFNRDIAPIVFEHCSPCHRPGQSGPFALLSFADVQKRRKQVLDVVHSGFMPPWPPSRKHGRLVGERGLGAKDIETLESWVAGGSPEGKPEDLPKLPSWTDGWQLGKPDLIVRMPEPYRLQAAGRDVYRNFVLPIPTSERRYICAMELRPGNRSVHHAFLLFDRSRQSRRMDAQDAEPGIPGMSPPPSAQVPEGQFVSWQPGKQVLPGSPDSIFNLEPATDLVLQMHLQPSGKEELIQAEVGFYFTNTPPSQHLTKLSLNSYSIRIPAGKPEVAVTDQYTLPVEGELLALVPHAHYLGKRVSVEAQFPGGTAKTLFEIPSWDFRWQGDYRFASPVALPKGTRLTMNWVYDNSEGNPFNPSHPPRDVVYGINTTNEMGELWLKIRTSTADSLAQLNEDIADKSIVKTIEFNRWRIQQNPRDPLGHARLGQALMTTAGGAETGVKHLRTALELDPTLDEAHFTLALYLQETGDRRAAQRELETTLRLNPDHSDAHGSLGLLMAELGNLNAAESHLRKAIELNPGDTLAREALQELMAARAKSVKK